MSHFFRDLLQRHQKSTPEPPSPIRGGSFTSGTSDDRHGVEYDFSDDEQGRHLRSLWTIYEREASKATTLEVKAVYLAPFAHAFIEAFQDWPPETILEAQERTVLGTPTPSRGGPPLTAELGVKQGGASTSSSKRKVLSSIAKTQGHASGLVVGIATSIMEFLDEHRKQAATSLSSPSSSLLGRQKGAGLDLHERESAILGTNVEDLSMCLAALTGLMRRDRWVEMQGGRRHLLTLLELLSILCKFHHNRGLIRGALGSGFARVLVSLLLALCRRGDKLVEEWGHDAGLVNSVEGCQALVSETRFTLACMYQCVQLVNYSIPTYPNYCYLVEESSVLPKHPWTAPYLASYCERRPDRSERGVMAGYRDIASQKPPFLTQAREEVERSLRGLAFTENWSTVLIRNGIIPTLCHVLRVTADLTQQGPSMVERERHLSTDLPPSSSADSGRPSSPPSCPLRDHYCLDKIETWPFLLFLQCEILIGLGASAAAHPREALEDLCQPSCRGVLLNILSFQDMMGRIESCRLRDLGGKRVEELYWERTDLILEFIKECVPIVTACSKANASRRVALREFMSILKALPFAIDRIGVLFPRSLNVTVEEEEASAIDDNEEEITCLVECPPNVEPPPYQYDLWPWTEGRHWSHRMRERERRRSDDTFLAKSSCTTYCLSDVSLAEMARSLHAYRKERRPHWHRPCTQVTVLTSIFAHLIDICELSPSSDFSSSSTSADPKDLGSLVGYALEIIAQVLSSAAPRDAMSPRQPPDSPVISLESLRLPFIQRLLIIFIHACLTMSPLETIAACRHLRLWKVLLLAVGIDRRAYFIDEHIRQECRFATCPSKEPPTSTSPNGIIYRYIIHVPHPAPPLPSPTVSASELPRAHRVLSQPLAHPFLAWIRVQDLCLELFHFVLLAAQRPPTSNFISSATMEVGFLVSILERQDEDNMSDVTVLQLCRWLHMIIIEYEALGASTFNEHGQRILTLLPWLLEKHSLFRRSEGDKEDDDNDLVPTGIDRKSDSQRPLWWPAHHALLSLYASIVNIASTSDNRLTLDYWLNGMIVMADKIGRMETWSREMTLKDYLGRGPSKTGLDVFFNLLSYESCQSCAIFIITRLMHTLAQVSKDDRDGGALNVSSSGAGGNQGMSGLSVIYNEFLHDLAIRHSQGNHGAVAHMLRGLGVLLREPQYDHLVAYHQTMLRKAGIFHVLAEIMDDTVLRFGPHVVEVQEGSPMKKLGNGQDSIPDFVTVIINQGLSLLTALISNNKANKQAFRMVFLQQRSSLLSFSLSRETPWAGGGPECRLFQLIYHGCKASFDTVRLLFDLMVDGRLPVELMPGMEEELGGDPRCDDCKAKFAVMKNREMVYIIFHLMPLLEDDLQAAVLRILRAMVSGILCELNSELRAMLMDLLLDIFLILAPEPQQAAIDLMAEVGVKYLNVAQLKRIFCLLHPLEDSRPHYTWKVLDALQTMVTPDVGPAQYFLFDGVKSGLRLPPIANWSKKYYSFCTWLWVDRPACGGECDRRSGGRGGGGSSQDLSLGTALERYKPYLLSLLSEDGTGVEVYLVPPRQEHKGRASFEVRIEVRRGKSCQLVQWRDATLPEFVPPQIPEGDWCFIGLSHRAATFRSPGEVLLVVNADHFRGTLNYPTLKLTSTGSFIGNRTSNKAHRNSDDLYRQVNNCLRGKMGPIYFFDDALSDLQYRGIRNKGPNYSFSLEATGSAVESGSNDVTSRGDGGSSPTPNDDGGGGGRSPSSISSRDTMSGTVDGFLVSKIILLFHPGTYRTWVSGLDVSVVHDIDDQSVAGSEYYEGRGGTSGVGDETSGGPYFDRRKRRIFDLLRASASMSSHTHAVLLRGSYANTNKDVRDAFDSLGGIKVLYPLFRQFELPVVKQGDELDYSVDTNLCVKLLDLLGKLLYYSSPSSSNRRFVQENNGFFFIGYFLERLSPQHTSYELVEAIGRLLNRWLGWQELMLDQAILHLLANFKIWVLAEAETQIEALKLLRSLVAEHSNRMRKAIGIQKMMDALTFFYWYDQPISAEADENNPSTPLLSQLISTESTLHADHVAHPETGELIGRRATGPSLVVIRREVLSIILEMMKEGADFSVGEAEAILGYLTQVRHPRARCEVLNLLLEVLDSDGIGAKEVVKAIVSVPGSVHVFLNLLSSEASTVRLLAFICTMTISMVSVSTSSSSSSLSQEPRNRRSSSTFSEALRRTSRTVSVDTGAVSAEGLVASPKGGAGEVLWRNMMELGLLSIERLQDAISRHSDTSIPATDECQVVSDTLLCLLVGQCPIVELVDRIMVLDVDMSDSLGRLRQAKDIRPKVRSPLSCHDPKVPGATYERYSDYIVVYPYIFPPLFHQLAYRLCPATPSLLNQLLFLTAILKRERNAGALMSIFGWQCYILRVISACMERLVAAVDDKGWNIIVHRDTEKSAMDLIFRIFNVLHENAIEGGYQHVLRTQTLRTGGPIKYKNDVQEAKRLGTVLLKETLYFLRIEAMRGAVDGVNVGSGILEGVVQEVKREVDSINEKLKRIAQEKKGGGQNSQQVSIRSDRLNFASENIWPLAALILSFVVNPPIQRVGSRFGGSGGTSDVATNATPSRSPIARSKEELLSKHLSFRAGSEVDGVYHSVVGTTWALSAVECLLNPSMWRLLKLTVEMLSLEQESLAWKVDKLVSEEKLARIIKQVSEAFPFKDDREDLPACLEPWSDPPAPHVRGSVSSDDSSLVFAGDVPWVLIRILTAMALFGPCQSSTSSTPVDANKIDEQDLEAKGEEMVTDDPPLADPSAICMEALTFLKGIMKLLALRKYRRLKLERLIMLGSFSRVLQHVSLSPQDPWLHSAADLVQLLASDCSPYLRPRVLHLGPSNWGSDHTPDPSEVQFQGLLVLSLGLSSPPDLAQWNNLFDDVMILARKQQADYISKHVENQEQRDSLQDVSDLVERVELHLKDMISNATTELFSSIGSVKDSYLTKSVKALRQLESKKRQAQTQWMRVLEELTNERGPWGRWAMGEKERIFWTLDEVEDTLRRRHKLRRNAQGSDHYMASVKRNAQGSGGRAKSDQLASEKVMRELSKYQKEGVKFMELGEEDEDEDEEVGDGKDRVASEMRASMRKTNRPPARLISQMSKLDLDFDSKGPAENVFLLNLECEVIQPFVVSPGNVELTTRYLTFNLQEGVSNLVPPNESYAWALKHMSTTTWNLEDLQRIFFRHYQQQLVAVELFFLDRTTLFLNLKTYQAAYSLCVAIRRLNLKNLEADLGERPRQVLQNFRVNQGHGLTRAWIQREISNFEYLCHLNTIAGRTFNDLAQYPIFPWVLSNYHSFKLDLREKANFRDFRWPMGAQKPSARQQLTSRYRDLQEQYEQSKHEIDEWKAQNPGVDLDEGPPPPMPPFHHGSHYSTAGFVIWYLMRMEPFTSLHIHLQSGRFDHADRLFRSITNAWDGCINNSSDVKELVPEFFYQPEFLYNINDVDLGQTQSGIVLGNISLPPWAKDPEEFIRINREALESEYVSAHLHHWIDLVFGYKQRPPHLGGQQAAVDACNVFFNITYAGGVSTLDLENMKQKNPVLYESTMKQINNFGQTPIQLFTKPHHQRLPLSKAEVIWPIASIVAGAGTTPHDWQVSAVQKPKALLSHTVQRMSLHPIVGIAEAVAGERLVTVDAHWNTAVHGWQVLSPDVLPPFRLKVDSSSTKITTTTTPAFSTPDFKALGASLRHMGSIKSSELSRVAAPPGGTGADSDDDDTSVSSTGPSSPRGGKTGVLNEGVDNIGYFDLAVDADAQLLFTCGYLDYSFKVTSFGGDTSLRTTPSNSIVQSIAQHRDVVRCLAFARDLKKKGFLVTGSNDCTVMVWEVLLTERDRDTPVRSIPVHTLCGHDDAVISVALSPAMDLVVSGSLDGSIIVHSLQQGRYLRSIYRDTHGPLSSLVTVPGGGSLDMSMRETGMVMGIDWVGISCAGYILTYSKQDRRLLTYSINGRCLADKRVGEILYALTLSQDGRVLVTGGTDREVRSIWCHNLELAEDGPREGLAAITVTNGACEELEAPPFPSAIRSIYLTAQERHMIVGLDGGDVYFLAPDANYLRERLKRKLQNLGFGLL